MKKLFDSKRFKHGSISIVFAVVFIAIIIVLNLMVGAIGDRFNLSMDITVDGIYTVSDTTVDMLQNLEEPVSVYIMLSEEVVETNAGFLDANELLKRMANYSNGMLSIEYVDLLQNPNFRNNFTNPDSIISGSIVMQSSKRDNIIDIYDLYDTSYDYQTGEEYTSGYQADQVIASSLHFVTTDEIPKAAFITGHGEVADNESFNAIFSSNSYELSQIQLINEEIPEDINTLIINAPTTDYSEEEIAKINEFLSLEVNNNLIVVYSQNMYELELLNRYLSEWGAEPGENIVIDTERAANPNPAIFIPELLSHEITDPIIQSEVEAVVVPGTTDINVTYDASGYRTTTVLMQSAESSYGKNFLSGETIDDITKQEGDAEGPFPLMLLTTDYQYVDNEPIYHNVVFISSPELIGTSVLDNAAYQNKSLITSVVDYINPDVDAVIVEAIDYKNISMVVTAGAATAVLVVCVILLPLVFVAVGIVVFIRRKNR